MFLLLFAAACGGGPQGLRATPDGDGPTVVVDWDAQPLPELPFPNDLATRPDPTSPTGRRLNISQEAPTQNERDARRKLDELSGFGVFAPITVAFDAPLDLDNILTRQANDFEKGDAAFADDALYVVDVTPGSPTYGQPVALDVGHGRYVYETEDTGQYYANDPLADVPSVVFDTREEDVNGNGMLDWGEDTDNDGILDHPNVWPEGGDARGDLLTFYELSSNTLIVRPVVPMREETRYAVVLTNRLVGTDGEPVRSPWDYVNHTSQTEALEPVVDALAPYGVSLDDIAYAWVFTTGRVTGDLVDVHRGLYGEGPFASLATNYPAGVNEALPLDDISGGDPWNLPTSTVIDALTSLGLLSGNSGNFIAAGYSTYSSRIVGGSFETPYFLADRDDGGVAGGDSDEWWELDAQTGTYSAEPARIPFTCILPNSGAEPYPVALFGHGHGSSRYDEFLFGWALNRYGIATCAIDWPGHGPSLDPDQLALAEAILGSSGLAPFLAHLQDSRYRDLTNDGIPDSGADQWIAEPFHTRDMVRQGIVDWTQLVRSFRACGTGQMTKVGVDGSDEGTLASCDWDGDGTPDIGTDAVPYTILGGSLGGINTAVAAAVMPEVKAFAPIVPGGGLLDVAIRSDLGGVVSAVVGRMISPLILGIPDGSGGLEIVQLVNQYGDMAQVHVATLASFPAGGKVVVDNIDSGETVEGWIPEDGTFRVGIAADAPAAFEKRAVVGMPETGPVDGVVYSSPDNVDLGDHLLITLEDADGTVVDSIDSFDQDVTYEGVTMVAGSPLVAASHGSGKIRSTPDVRRLAMVMAMALEPADPAVYAPHWINEPFPELGGKPTNILVAPNVGDQGVSVSTGLTLARAGGLLDWQNVDPRYGETREKWLIEHEVERGIEAYGPYVDKDGNPALFDPDDLDEGTDGTGAPSETPLRATRHTASGTSGLRLPYPQTTGRHGFNDPDPAQPFDAGVYLVNQVALYFASQGATLTDEVCLGNDSCPELPPIVWEAE